LTSRGVQRRVRRAIPRYSEGASVAGNAYTFGTTAEAAARLEDIGRFFNPPAAELVTRFAPERPETAVDLGCGPGFTTDMLAGASGARNTCGLDSSAVFLDLARKRFGAYTFLACDVTKAPLPVVANLMYCRFLLCHLGNPLGVIAGWLAGMRSGGVLIIEELDGIDTSQDVFRTYLAMSEGIVAAGGGSLYVGRALATADIDADVLLNVRADLNVPYHRAASWFYPNTVTIWKGNPFVSEHLDARQCRAIRAELQDLMRARDGESRITWHMRRLVLRTRTAPDAIPTPFPHGDAAPAEGRSGS